MSRLVFAFACIIDIMFPMMYRRIAFCWNHHFSIRSRHGRWYVHCIYDSGINVGRDMMGTMTNTLIFAYVGGAMTTLVINYAYDLSYRQLANSYVIGIEIMQGLSGSLGVVLTVPITALIASFLAVRKK